MTRLRPSPVFLPKSGRIRDGAGALLVLGLWCGACGDAAGPDAAHDPGHADAHVHAEGEAGHAEVPKTDAHHVAEGRTDCEDDVTLPEGALERYGIDVAPARPARLAPTVTAPGHLAFPQDAITRVGSAVSGRVTELRVRSGDAVAKGDVLLVIESPQLGLAQSDYLQARTIAATTAPAVELARSAHERAQQLFESVQGIPFSDVQRREVEWRQAERDRDVAVAAEAAARNALLLSGMSEPGLRALETTGRIEPRFTVTSPLAGRVVDVAVTLGELVDPGKDRLLVIGNLAALWAIAEVSESRLAEIAPGARARVHVAALPGLTADAVVTSIAPVLEAAMRTVEVRMEVPNADGRLLPGMFVTVELESNTEAAVTSLAVPDAAVLDIEGQSSVFLAVEAGGRTFCKHAVRVGRAVGTQVPILAGLVEGDLVVVSGTFMLKAEHGKASATHEH